MVCTKNAIKLWGHHGYLRIISIYKILLLSIHYTIMVEFYILPINIFFWNCDIIHIFGGVYQKCNKIMGSPSLFENNFDLKNTTVLYILYCHVTCWKVSISLGGFVLSLIYYISDYSSPPGGGFFRNVCL